MAAVDGYCWNCSSHRRSVLDDSAREGRLSRSADDGNTPMGHRWKVVAVSTTCFVDATTARARRTSHSASSHPRAHLDRQTDVLSLSLRIREG